MDFELEDFISHLGEDEAFPGNQQMNELWKELEEYFDKEFLDIDKFLDELLPSVQPDQPLMNDIQVSETSAQMSTEDFFRSFALSDSFYKELIPEPKLDFKNKNLVPTEMLLKAVQSRKVMVNSNYPSDKEPLFLAPSRNDVCENIKQKINCSKGSNIDWYTVLENIQLYPGITVDSIIKNIMCESTTLEIIPSKEEISSSVSLVFKVLNDYIGRLTEEFANYQFYDSSQFHDISLKHRNEVLTLSDVQTNLLQILTKWMSFLTEKFAHINEERRQIEESVSKKIIDEAVEMCRTKHRSIDRNEEIVTQGIRQVYLNCGLKFNAQILRQLKERFKEVNSTLDQSLISQTPEKSGLSRPKIHELRDSSVQIKLLVSEYVSNIKQKSLQCAGISTLDQFDDVNKNCRDDIMKKFERQMNGVPATERKDFTEQFKLRLDSESNNKRLEFERLKLSFSTGMTSPYTQTRSQSVGIHFGFETLSISYFNDISNTFRRIYGPAANLVSFTREGVFIGPIPSLADLLNMEQLLKTLNVNTTYGTEYHGEFKIEAIIALVFMKIDEMVKKNLHTETRIKYSIAIPSCLNQVMQNTFKVAMNIGNIDGNLVFEPYALSAHFIRESHQFITKNNDEFLIVFIEDSNNACDSVVYKIPEKNGRIIEIENISGSESLFRILRRKPGVQVELEKIKAKSNKRIRFLIFSPNQENIKGIKNQFSKAKVHSFKLDSIMLADGAAILSSVANGNGKFKCSFDLRNLTVIKRLPERSNDVYRLKHYGKTDCNISQISTKLHSLLVTQSENFIKCKASTKRLLIGKIKDLEVSTLPENEKQSYGVQLQKALQEVEKEICSEVVIKEIADTWRGKCF